MTEAVKKILVADRISAGGLEILEQGQGFQVEVRTGLAGEELAAAVREHDALVVRSATKVTAEVLARPGRLKVIGRAGTGVDNIDLEAATLAGVVVVNTPGGNSLAAAELTFSILLALARHIPQANAALRAGRWERKEHMGIEVAGKTLGVLGLGRIGRQVARRALAFDMEVLGYDPYVAQESVEDLGIRCVTVEQLLAAADVVTLHLPLSEQTRDFMNSDRLAAMKPGARLINCARGGLVDEAALLSALESGHLGGAGLDVFSAEPPQDQRLVDHARVVSTPHLGASTEEAQERVGRDVARKIRDFLESGTVLDAVNFPSVSREEQAILRPVMELAESLGRLLGQISDGAMRGLKVECFGEFNHRPLRPLMMAAVKGLLSPVLAEEISYVNALPRAGERGLTISESRSNEVTPYAGLLRLSLSTAAGETSVAGALFGAGSPRLVEVDAVKVECHLAGHLLFFRNDDVPGVVGRIGTILGEGGVNIAGIQLGRSNASGDAVSLVSVDSPVPDAVMNQIRQLPEIRIARGVRV
jgi:D-3-phosphoglycerate dehydrogenase